MRLLTTQNIRIFGLLLSTLLLGACVDENALSSNTASNNDAPIGVVIPGDETPPVTEPDPAPVEPDPAPVIPPATPVEPDPAPVEPDPTPVEPDPTPVEPDPAPVEPDPAPSLVTTQVSWTIPSTRILGDFLPMSELQGYKVYYGSAPGNYTETLVIEDAQQTSTDVIVESGQTYYFVVRAIDTDGLEGPESNIVTRSL